MLFKVLQPRDCFHILTNQRQRSTQITVSVQHLVVFLSRSSLLLIFKRRSRRLADSHESHTGVRLSAVEALQFLAANYKFFFKILWGWMAVCDWTVMTVGRLCLMAD